MSGNKLKTVYEIPDPKVKEDLIGKTHPCPFPGCTVKSPVTAEGVSHAGDRHWYRYTLDELFALVKINNELEFKLWFGTK